MTLNVKILNHDFSTPPIQPPRFNVDRLTWTAFGGPDTGIISTSASTDRLLEFTSLLRCPVVISGPDWTPCWWGFVDQVTMTFDNVRFTVELDRVFNRVQVRYSPISPDRKLVDVLETPWIDNYASVDLYGKRDKVIYLRNVDDEFAFNYRNTFLADHAFGTVQFSPSKSSTATLQLQQTVITLRLAGWFSTLGWMGYENLHGLWANHGPGPGAHAFGTVNVSAMAQSFYVNKTCQIQYAYVFLRKKGNPASSIQATINNTSGTVPGTILQTSDAYSGLFLPEEKYSWTRFTFNPPLTVTGPARYWLLIHPNIADNNNHYIIKLDENSSFKQDNQIALRTLSGT